MSEISIEAIAQEHAHAYRSLLEQAAKQEKYLGLTEAPPMDVVQNAVTESHKCGYPMYLAFSGDTAIGWCCIYQNTHPNFKHLGQLFIGVIQSWQGLGIGKALLEMALWKASENGLRRVELEVCAKNLPAVHLYRRFGFRDEGIKKSAYYVDSRYEDVIIMGLLLDGSSGISA